METLTTIEKPTFTVAIGIDTKSAAIIAIALFIALLGALVIYKQL